MTFVGVSARNYSAAERAQLRAVFGALQRDGVLRNDSIVCAGATASGIGAVYAVAQAAGLRTLGIVSARALASGAAWAADVATIVAVDDASWGGFVPQRFVLGARHALQPTSAAMVGVSAAVVGLSGGRVAFAELVGAQERGRDVRFYASTDKVAAGDDAALQLILAAKLQCAAPPHHLFDRCGVCGGAGDTCSDDFTRDMYVHGDVAVRRAPFYAAFDAATKRNWTESNFVGAPVAIFDPEQSLILSDPNDPLRAWTPLPGAKEKLAELKKTHIIVLLVPAYGAEVMQHPISNSTAAPTTVLPQMSTSVEPSQASTSSAAATTAAQTTNAPQTTNSSQTTAAPHTSGAATTSAVPQSTSTSALATTASGSSAMQTTVSERDFVELLEAHRKRAATAERDADKPLYPRGEFNETYVRAMEKKLDSMAKFFDVPFVAGVALSARGSYRIPYSPLFERVLDVALTPQNGTVGERVWPSAALVIGNQAGREGDDSCLDRDIALFLRQRIMSMHVEFRTTQQWLLGWNEEDYDCDVPLPMTTGAAPDSGANSPAHTPAGGHTTAVEAAPGPADGKTGLSGFGYFAIGFAVAGLAMSGVCCFLLQRQKRLSTSGYQPLNTA